MPPLGQGHQISCDTHQGQHSATTLDTPARLCRHPRTWRDSASLSTACITPAQPVELWSKAAPGSTEVRGEWALLDMLRGQVEPPHLLPTCSLLCCHLGPVTRP